MRKFNTSYRLNSVITASVKQVRLIKKKLSDLKVMRDKINELLELALV